MTPMDRKKRVNSDPAFPRNGVPARTIARLTSVFEMGTGITRLLWPFNT